MYSPNIFLGTKEYLNIHIDDVVQTIPHGKLFIPSDESDAEMYVDNYLITGHSISNPYINVFHNDKNGYKLILKEFIPNWKYTPIDWSKEDSDGEEYSTELFKKITNGLFQDFLND
jgi:hypothetical protein